MEENKKVTLSELRQEEAPKTRFKFSNDELPKDISNMQEASISNIAPYKGDEEPKESIIDSALNEVDLAIEALAQESMEFARKRHEEEIEESIMAEIEDEDDIESEIEEDDDEIEDESIHQVKVTEEPKQKRIIVKTEEDSIIEDNKDIEKELEEEINEEIEDKNEDDELDEQLSDLKTSLKEKVHAVTNKIDLSTFSISNKPISIANALKTKASHIPKFKWGLFETGLPLTMTEFKGFDITNLSLRNYTDRYQGYTEIYKLIYDHIVDENKPKTCEQWLKLINFYDIQHLYFGIYQASFKDANYIPYNCPHCGETFISDNLPIESMVKYKDDATKEYTKEVMNKCYDDDTSKYDIELVQVSDDYVIGFREPSIFNVIFENAILDQKFTEKYAKVLSNLSFIDTIYTIDRETSSLRPIECDYYPNNLKKSVKSKIVKYNKILNMLNSDQLYEIDSIINSIGKKHETVSYVLPEIKCPKCGKTIEEEEMGTENMLFMRHQLKSIANS